MFVRIVFNPLPPRTTRRTSPACFQNMHSCWTSEPFQGQLCSDSSVSYENYPVQPVNVSTLDIMIARWVKYSQRRSSPVAKTIHCPLSLRTPASLFQIIRSSPPLLLTCRANISSPGVSPSFEVQCGVRTLWAVPHTWSSSPSTAPGANIRDTKEYLGFGVEEVKIFTMYPFPIWQEVKYL